MLKRCTRCQLLKEHNSFREDSSLVDVCMPCFNNHELNDYVRSDISKAMDGLTVREKKMIIQQLIDEFKKSKEVKDA